MVDIMAEAKNDANLERIIRFLRRYALPLVLLILIVTIVYNVWGSYHDNISTELGDKLYSASTSNDIEQKKKLLQEVASSKHNYHYIASLTLADLLQQDGQTEEALKLYNNLATENNADRYITDVAKQRIMLINKTDNNDNSIYYFTNMLLQEFVLLNKGEKDTNLLNGLQESFDMPLPIKDLVTEVNAALANQ